MKPTLITLSPRNSGDNSIQVATFEEAFGEFSQARGRGRARRQKRRMERIQNKDERRRTRGTNRISRRAEVQAGRQGLKANRLESRQTRKDTKKTRRVARKAIGQEEEPLMEDQGGYAENQGGGYSEDQGGGYSEDQGGASSQDQGGYAEDQGGYAEDQGGGYSEDQGGEGYSEDDGGEGYSEDDGGEYAEEGDSGFDGGQVFDPTNEFNGAEDSFTSELGGAEDYFLNIDGVKQKINPTVREITKKIEWNKELLQRLNLKLANAKSEPMQESIKKQIATRKARLKMLESKLEGYSSARGRGKAERNRRREIRKARRLAKRDRMKVALANAPARKMAQKLSNGGSETPVDKELNPEIAQDSIVIPAEESNGANGDTGYIGNDDQDDFDAPASRKFDLTFSNAEGKKKGMSTGVKIAIGVAIGVVAIVLINKYLLKKK